MTLKRTTLFELDFINDNNFDATINSMLNFKKEFPASENKMPLLFTPNVDDVVKLNEKKYAELAAILKTSYYLLPDGQPIIWASKLLGKKLGKRLPGSELFPLLWKEVIKQNRKVMMVAPSIEVGELMKKEYPALEYFVPPFFNSENIDEVNAVLKQAIEIFDIIKPEYVFIGIRFPKQNYIALGLIEHVKKSPTLHPDMPLFLLMGASYEFYLGLKKRAPAFWQKTGLEWFYRFTQEPGRLFKRYFVDDLQFIPIFIKEWRKK